jgi:hypothetical protein
MSENAWVNNDDVAKMTAALSAFRAYEWWFKTENPDPGEGCLSPLVLQNMKLGYENGSLYPTMHQFKNLLTTAIFYQQKCFSFAGTAINRANEKAGIDAGTHNDASQIVPAKSTL